MTCRCTVLPGLAHVLGDPARGTCASLLGRPARRPARSGVDGHRPHDLRTAAVLDRRDGPEAADHRLGCAGPLGGGDEHLLAGRVVDVRQVPQDLVGGDDRSRALPSWSKPSVSGGP